ncbi:two-component system sensor histidine kinase ArlS [Lysinibacillus composti]|uniref:Signal transduction histidine-protein kinase ArlS n=1 Tax=Lysinibacillus composti TaxID=720633 RepID=A0A3N9UKF7_9BACI|nr:HAMP domain-containing histidine kinase [Lysinibacillus composti]MBM7607697.1 two-component system sensor histidine kinase ArlS [Lysinibacillus composti]RQW75808.1 sensor histidine kinase [Lysinibacillus composti]
MNKVKNFFMNLSLKKKWTLSSTIVIFISYAAICTIIYLALYTWLIHNEEDNAIRTVDDLTAFFGSQEGPITISELQQSTGLMKAIINQNQTVRIFNLDGYEVLRINNTSPAATLEKSELQYFDTMVMKKNVEGNDVFVLERVVQIGRFQGYLQLIHPLNSFQSMMKYVLTAMLIAGIGALLVAGSISYYLANLLMKPLQDLRDSMVSVREKGFDEEISVTYKADDEIGDLITIYQSMIDELHSSFKKQHQFVSDASHELRTPIQAIEGHLSLIKRWGKNDPEVLEESLHTSITEVQRMKKMIEELLDLARKEEKEQHAYADVQHVLESVIMELQFVHKEANVNVQSYGVKKDAHITENALSQILRNIIENGIRYTEHQPVINIEINYLPDNLFITIKDNGIGISNEHLPHIFDRFYRIDASRKSNGGTGLGLSITKMLAERYDVKINVTSKVNLGTTFTLRFPIV